MSDISIFTISVVSLIGFGMFCDTIKAIFIAKYKRDKN